MWRPGGEDGFSLVDLLAAVGIIAVVGAIAIPMTGTAVNGQRFKGDAQALNNLVGLAKMRASSTFTRARVRVNLTDDTFVLERWDKADNAWVLDGGTERMSRNVRFSFGDLSTPPPNTQAEILQSPPCRVGLTSATAAIGNTACIVFNSRGLPVDGNGLIFGGHAIYMTDGTAVYATTVTATPRVRLWWIRAGGTTWVEQQ